MKLLSRYSSSKALLSFLWDLVLFFNSMLLKALSLEILRLGSGRSLPNLGRLAFSFKSYTIFLLANSNFSLSLLLALSN